jgi:hypothetical protein
MEIGSITDTSKDTSKLSKQKSVVCLGFSDHLETILAQE